MSRGPGAVQVALANLAKTLDLSTLSTDELARHAYGDVAITRSHQVSVRRALNKLLAEHRPPRAQSEPPKRTLGDLLPDKPSQVSVAKRVSVADTQQQVATPLPVLADEERYVPESATEAEELRQEWLVVAERFFDRSSGLDTKERSALLRAEAGMTRSEFTDAIRCAGMDNDRWYELIERDPLVWHPSDIRRLNEEARPWYGHSEDEQVRGHLYKLAKDWLNERQRYLRALVDLRCQVRRYKKLAGSKYSQADLVSYLKHTPVTDQPQHDRSLDDNEVENIIREAVSVADIQQEYVPESEDEADQMKKLANYMETHRFDEDTSLWVDDNT